MTAAGRDRQAFTKAGYWWMASRPGRLLSFRQFTLAEVKTVPIHPVTVNLTAGTRIVKQQARKLSGTGQP